MALDNGTGIVKPEDGFNVIKAASEQRASNTFAAIKAHELLDQQDASAKEMQSITMADGLNAATISAAKSSFEASSDAKKAAQNLALGFDPLDQGSKSNYWIGEMHDNAAKAYAALDVVNAGTSKTLLNDPLGYIAAQFTLPADIAAQHYYVDKYNAAAGSLNEITSASSAASIAINQSQQTTNAAMASAKADQALQAAALASATIKRDTAGTQIKGVLEINALNEKQSDLVFKVHQAQNSDAQLAISQQNAADMHAQRLIMQQQRQEQLDAKQDDLAGWQAQLDNRNAGARAMGKPVIEGVGTFKREVAQFGKLPNYQDMLTVGATANANGGSISGVPIAENAGNAARNWASPGTNLTGNVTGTYLAQVWNQQKGLATAPKDVQALASHVTDIAVAGAKVQRDSIDNSNPLVSNIYQAPIPAIMFQSQSVKNNPFLAEVLAPIVELDSKATISDATMLAKAAFYAKNNPGTANFNIAAAGITAYYKQASNVNNSTNRYVENSLPPQLSYIARINGANLNLTSEADVKRAMFMMNMKDAASGNSWITSAEN